MKVSLSKSARCLDENRTDESASVTLSPDRQERTGYGPRLLSARNDRIGTWSRWSAPHIPARHLDGNLVTSDSTNAGRVIHCCIEYCGEHSLQPLLTLL